MGLRPTTLAHSQHFARHGAAVPKQEPTPRAPQYVGEREKRAAAAAAVKPAKAPPKPPTPPAPPPPAKDAAAAKDIPQLPRAPPGAGNIPKMAAPPPPAGPGAFTHLPRELGSFASRLPDARSVGACPPNLVDAVMDAILTSDVSPDGGASAIEALNESRGAVNAGEKRKAGGDPVARLFYEKVEPSPSSDYNASFTFARFGDCRLSGRRPAPSSRRWNRRPPCRAAG